jgi:hypothetical protein
MSFVVLYKLRKIEILMFYTYFKHYKNIPINRNRSEKLKKHFFAVLCSNAGVTHFCGKDKRLAVLVRTMMILLMTA